jgi:dTDP-4-amino-4,6-dideoxygalactose transaminase
MSTEKLAIHGGIPVRSTPYRPLWPVFGVEEERQLNDVLRITKEGMGRPIGKISEFEEKFAAFHSVAAAVTCTNCSQALEIMLAVSGVKPGDEVIVPSFTYVATAGAVVAVGAIPVFADIEPATYQIDPNRIEEVITERTVAIIPVHFSGHFSDMEKICAIAEKKGLLIIEDAAHAHGAKWNGKYPGQYGAAAGFSFQYGKNMTAQEGGIIISDSAEYVERCWEYIWYGRRRGDAWYKHYMISSNYRLTELQGAILLAQLSKLQEQNERRGYSAELLDNLLLDIEGVSSAHVDPRTEIHPRHLYPVRFSNDVLKKAGGKKMLVDAVNAEGIPLLHGYEFPLYQTPAFQSKSFRCVSWYSEIYNSVDYGNISLEECEQACHDTTWFLHNALLGTEEDMKDMAMAIRKVVKNIDQL